MTSSSKTRRVRTGCLTCRSRHLKCDEETPECRNCVKSKRPCDRGRRLKFDHFIDCRPLRYTAKDQSYVEGFKFQDESLRIARQYKGGLGLYGQSEEDALSDSEKDSDSFTDESLDDSFTSGSLSSQAVSSYHSDMIKSSPSRTYSSTPQQWKHQTLPPTDTVGVKYYPTPVGLAYLNSDAMTSSSSDSHTGNQMLTPADSQSADDIHAAAYRNLASYSGFDSYVHSEDSGSKLNVSSPRSPPLSRSQSSSRSLASDDEREYLSSLEDVQYLQTFNDDIAVWMNAFDPERHFEKSIPHRAMECPTLLSALLACGASSVGKQIAHCHYDTATQRIMSVKGRLNVDEIIDGDDLAELAAAAVVLYVFETATSTLERKAIHTSEARDMIQQGRWDGSSPGLGGACFWLFVVTEVLTCLAMNWQVSWKPDAWAVDMDMGFADGQVSDFSDGKDEIWVHRIFYILAKVSDFRATASKFDMTDPRQMLGERLPQWRQLEKLCEKWKATCPLTMRPYAYINPGAPGLKSRFPFIRFSTFSGTLGRLFYHTARCVLAQTNPRASIRISDEMKRMELHHAQQICGIVAATSPAMRLRPEAAVACSLAIAEGALDDPQQREEVACLMMRNQGVSFLPGAGIPVFDEKYV